jgi:hypothetical protein
MSTATKWQDGNRIDRLVSLLISLLVKKGVISERELDEMLLQTVTGQRLSGESHPNDPQ